MEVTFDTNTFRDLVEPQKRKLEHVLAYERILEAIQDGRVQPFLSDSIVLLEGIAGYARADFYQRIRVLQNIEISPLYQTAPNGEVAIVRHVDLQPDFKHRRALPKELVEALLIGEKLGFSFIKVPRVGQQRLDTPKYKIIPEDVLFDVLERASFALFEIEKKGFGAAAVEELSRQVIAKRPELLMQGEMRAFAFSEDWRKVSKAVAEWSDGDGIAAHYAYRHNYFCTRDEGRGAGVTSVLHSANRSWLKNELDVEIVSPTELARLI